MPLKGPRGAELLQGELITLLTSAARGATAGTNGTAIPIYAERLIYTWLLDVTAAATDVTDTLDVYIDTLIDATWINAVHFTQVLGNGGAKKFFATTMPENLGISTDITSDCAVGITRGIVGSEWRARWVIIDPGAGAASFTFSLIGYAA